MKGTRHHKNGFTLLELLMVVIIIAILASIALPQYIRAAERSRAAEAIQLIGAIRSSELRYAAQSNANVYTTVLTELDVTFGPNARWAAPVIKAAAGPIGAATTARSAGQFVGGTVGLQFGTGTLCGTFAPLGVADCVND